MNDNKKKQDGLQDAALLGAVEETVMRHGGAVKEHLVGYTGIDNETGEQLKRSLKSIANSKVNPDYKSTNLKQQAGFAAEVKETANYNANAKINGSSVKKIRTDDIGRVNDPLYDHLLIDENGKIILGSGSQMKFVGSNPGESLNRLMSPKFSKYLENDVDIEVPSDFYQGILDEANNKIATLKKQLDRQISDGNTEQVEKLTERIEKLQKIKSKLKKSSVSNKEAMFARQHPVLSTAKSIAETANHAGKQGAKMGGTIGGGFSALRNVADFVQDNQTLEETLLNTAKDTALAAADGYMTAASSSVISGVMKNAASETTRALAKTTLPTTVVLIAKETTAVLAQYMSGEITGAQALEQLGERGTAMLSAGAFAFVGQMAIPVPVLGAMIGSMFGYALSTAGYAGLKNSLMEAEIAHERRIQLEEACEQHIKLMRQYQQNISQIISEYMTDSLSTIQTVFADIHAAYMVGDVERKVEAFNQLTRISGQEPLFETREQGIALMLSDEPIIL